MEAAFNKKNNGSIPKECTDLCGKMNNTCCSFSNQEVADCTLGGADTCDLGGEPHDGILEIANDQHGLVNTDEDYPYVSGKSGKLSKCTPKSSSAISTGIKGYANITSGDEDALTKAAYVVFERLLSHVFTRMSIVSLLSFVSLIYIRRKSLEHATRNAQMHTQILRTLNSRFALEHRYSTRPVVQVYPKVWLCLRRRFSVIFPKQSTRFLS